jgi:hypothetical protein
MDTNVKVKEESTDLNQTTQEDSIEYKSGGFNRWGVNVENDSRISRHSSVYNDFKDLEEPKNSAEEEVLNPVSAGELASSVKPEDTSNYTENSVEVESNDAHQEDSSESEDTVDNFAYYVAKQMIEEGALPNFDDVDKDITFEDIYETYKESASEIVMSEVMSKVDSSLKSAGVTEENIVLLQAIQNGVPLDELYEVNKYQKYSSLDEDTDDDKKLEVIKEWYKSRNLSEKEIKRNLEAIELSDEIGSEFNDAKNFFSDTIQRYAEAQKQIAIQEMQQRMAIQQMNEQILYNAVNQGILSGEKLTKEQSRQIYNDIYEKSRVYDVNGGKVYLSPFEEYLYKLNNDFEFQLLNYKNFRWRNNEIDILKAKAEEETEKDYLEAFKKSQIKSASKSSLKRNTSSNKDGFNVYKNETGGRTFEF